MSNEFRKLEDVLSELKGNCVSSPRIFYVKDIVTGHGSEHKGASVEYGRAFSMDAGCVCNLYDCPCDCTCDQCQ